MREGRARVRSIAASIREDRYRYFPEWYRRDGGRDLSKRPLFIVGTGFGEAEFLARGQSGELDVRGLVDTRLTEFFVDGLLWRATPALRRLPALLGRDAPRRIGALRRLAVETLSSGIGLTGNAPLLALTQWVERARKTPGSLSIIIAQGPDALRFKRIASTAGINAMVVTEALRTPDFAHCANGQVNDLLGDMPARIEEFLALEEALSDEESVRVLHAVLRYRLTLDHDDIDPVVHHPWREYFASGLFDWNDAETLYDVGAFTGDTLLRFMDSTAGRFRRAVCLEPDDHNFFFLEKLRSTLEPSEAERVVCRKQGAWNKVTRLQFSATGDTAARILENAPSGTSSIDVTTIDAMAAEHGVPTFVKVDAEGADRQVLEGGLKTFAQHRSRVAVSAYHLQDDLLVLTRQLRDANADYRLSMRQYFPGHWDSIIYAY